MNKKKQRLGTAVIILITLLIAGGSLYVFFMTRKESTQQQEMMRGGERFSGMDGMVTASGTTAIGMDAREELENIAKEAELSYRSSVITTNQSKIQAKYTYEKAILEAKQAAQVYEDTVAELQAKLDKAKSAYDDAQEAYNELYDAVTNNTLCDMYEVDKKKAAYQETHEMYITMVAESDISEEELVSSSSGGQSMSGKNTMTQYGKRTRGIEAVS